MAITYTQTHLDALIEALATGAKSVQVGDRKIEYNSQKELLALIAMIQKQLDGVDTTQTSSKNVPYTFSKGGS
jgi:hypothetical protein